MTVWHWLSSPMIVIYGTVAVYAALGKRGRAAVRRAGRTAVLAVDAAATWTWYGLYWRWLWRRVGRLTDPRARIVLEYVARHDQGDGVLAADLYAALGWPHSDLYAVLDALCDAGHLTAIGPGVGSARRVYRIPEDGHG